MTGALGKSFPAGAIIFRQGEPAECMYIIRSGKVEVFREVEGREEVALGTLGPEDILGEMGLVEKSTRIASARALTEVRVMSIDRKMFLRKVHEDPSLAFRVIQKMSRRIRDLNDEVARLSAKGRS